jgi:hypothetical protein
MPLPKVIQLRQVLSEKFPGLKLRLEEKPAAVAAGGQAPGVDDLLQSREARGSLTEIIAGAGHPGSATLIREMVRWSAAHHRIIGLVDGADTFDAGGMENGELAQLLWVRCTTAETALKAADYLLRDGNLSAVILDLKANGENQLRKIPATTWYRFQRLVEISGTAGLVITPRPMVASASTRLVLRSHFSLEDLEREPADLVRAMSLEPAQPGQSEQREASLKSA